MAELSVLWRWHLQPLWGGAGRPAVTVPVSSCPTPAAALEQSTGQAGPLRAHTSEQCLGLSFPRLAACLSQGGLCSPVSSSVQFSGKKLGQMSPAASYLHQAALRTHPGHHPGPPGRSLAPNLAPPMCSQTTSLRKEQHVAQPRAPTSQNLLPSTG